MGLTKVLMIIGGAIGIFGVGILGCLCLLAIKNENENEIKHENLWIRLSAVAIVYGIAFAMFFGLCLAVLFNDEQDFLNIIKEKQEVVAKIQSGEYNDPLMQKTYVDLYNRKVEDAKSKSENFSTKDLYSKDVDWQALEPLDLDAIQNPKK